MADLVVTAADVLKAAGSRLQTGTAGEAVTAGQTVYQHTDALWYKADCTTAAKAACVGVALHGSLANQPLTIVKSGPFDPGAVVVVGTVYGVTDTAGGIGAISERGAADYITVIGVGTAADKIEMALNVSGVAVPA